ncbi:SRPBCC family protein [Nocardia stercoris]|uniref:SRPBCC family protein n=2 Tax=Nocardia stercoris TaxID=2483361 RepID=A0A3M2L530_9NOCA|nr:SRPBCC family protein [Nocardia stercoris]
MPAYRRASAQVGRAAGCRVIAGRLRAWSDSVPERVGPAERAADAPRIEPVSVCPESLAATPGTPVTSPRQDRSETVEGRALHTVELDRTIHAPIEAVFEWFNDGTNYERLALVRRVTLIRPGATEEHGVGAVRLAILPFFRFNNEIVAYDPPHSFGYQIRHSIPPLDHDGVVTFESIRGNATHVHWHVDLQMKTRHFAGILTELSAPYVYGGLAAAVRAAERELRGTTTRSS